MTHTDSKYKHSELTDKIIRCAYNVFDELGSGFLETVYQNALQIELKQNGFQVEVQHPIKVLYKGVEIGQYYADLFVEEKITIELKAVQILIKAHEVQLYNYLKATSTEVGLLINFGDTITIKRRYLKP